MRLQDLKLSNDLTEILASIDFDSLPEKRQINAIQCLCFAYKYNYETATEEKMYNDWLEYKRSQT